MVFKTELLFPPNSLHAIAQARDTEWQVLVNSIEKLGETSVEQAAMVLMISRLANCSSCTPNSFRATEGCAACSLHVLKHFRSLDEELLGLFLATCQEVDEYLQIS